MDEIKCLASVYFHGFVSKDETTACYAFSRRMPPDIAYSGKAEKLKAFMQEGMDMVEQFEQSLTDGREIERIDVYESIDTQTYEGDSRPGMIVTYRMMVNQKMKR